MNPKQTRFVLGTVLLLAVAGILLVDVLLSSRIGGSVVIVILGLAGFWEFAPGGAVEAGRPPEDVVRAELREETGLALRDPPTPVALLYDHVVRCWELIYELRADDPESAQAGPEYDDLAWCAADALPEPLSPIARRMAGLL